MAESRKNLWGFLPVTNWDRTTSFLSPEDIKRAELPVVSGSFYVIHAKTTGSQFEAIRRSTLKKELEALEDAESLDHQSILNGLEHTSSKLGKRKVELQEIYDDIEDDEEMKQHNNGIKLMTRASYSYGAICIISIGVLIYSAIQRNPIIAKLNAIPTPYKDNCGAFVKFDESTSTTYYCVDYFFDAAKKIYNYSFPQPEVCSSNCKDLGTNRDEIIWSAIAAPLTGGLTYIHRKLRDGVIQERSQVITPQTARERLEKLGIKVGKDFESVKVEKVIEGRLQKIEINHSIVKWQLKLFKSLQQRRSDAADAKGMELAIDMPPLAAPLLRKGSQEQ